MSMHLRALLIGMLGPALQATGVAWDLLEHGLLARGEIEHLTFEHIVSGPAHLMMATGFAVSVICIPLALQVATARSEESVPSTQEPSAPFEQGGVPEPVKVARRC